MSDPHGAVRRKLWLFIAIVAVTNPLGNLALKWGIDHAPRWPERLFSPWLLAGVLLLIAWTLARMALLSWTDLSFVLPVTATGYVLTALLGRFFLGEHISGSRWAGTLLIVAGVALVGATSPSTTPRSES